MMTREEFLALDFERQSHFGPLCPFGDCASHSYVYRLKANVDKDGWPGFIVGATCHNCRNPVALFWMDYNELTYVKALLPSDSAVEAAHIDHANRRTVRDDFKI